MVFQQSGAITFNTAVALVRLYLKSLAIKESGNINLIVWYDDLPIERQDDALQKICEEYCGGSTPTPFFSEYLCNFVS